VLTIDDIPESHRSLIQAPLIGVFTTVDNQNRPQSTAVCYRAVDDAVLLAVGEKRQKVINLRGNPNCSLLIVDRRNPMRTLEIRAIATLAPDAEMSELNAMAAAYGIDPEPLRAIGGARWTVRLGIRRVLVSPAP
jgi:PPOX class probable F420-dependent enzyme